MRASSAARARRSFTKVTAGIAAPIPRARRASAAVAASGQGNGRGRSSSGRRFATGAFRSRALERHGQGGQARVVERRELRRAGRSRRAPAAPPPSRAGGGSPPTTTSTISRRSDLRERRQRAAELGLERALSRDSASVGTGNCAACHHPPVDDDGELRVARLPARRRSAPAPARPSPGAPGCGSATPTRRA